MCPLRAAEDSETLRCRGSCRGPQLKGEVVSVGASPGVLVAAAVGARASVLSLLGRRVVAQLRVCGVTLRISRVTEPRRGKKRLSCSPSLLKPRGLLLIRSCRGGDAAFFLLHGWKAASQNPESPSQPFCQGSFNSCAPLKWSCRSLLVFSAWLWFVRAVAAD